MSLGTRIAVGVLDGSPESAPRLEKVPHDEVSIRRLVSRRASRAACGCVTRRARRATSWLGCCARAGACEVIAPSLIPARPG